MPSGLAKPADRVLQVGPLTSKLSMSDPAFGRGFVALIPAFSPQDENLAQAIVTSLVEQGCIEVCCVGPRAEVTHDKIDSVIEDLDALSVVTTWDADISEGVEYFLQLAGGGALQLLGLVAGHDSVRRPLLDMASGMVIKSFGEPTRQV